MKQFATFVFDNTDLEEFVRWNVGRRGYQVSDLKLEGDITATVQAEKKPKKAKEAANPAPALPFHSAPATGKTAPPAPTSPGRNTTTQKG